MITSRIAVGALAVCASIGLASAASAAANGPAAQAQSPSGAVTASGGSSGASQGWNFVHPKNCSTVSSGSAAVFYLYSSEGPWIYTTNPYESGILVPACQSGNWIAFYVYDTSGDWNETFTYTFK